MHANKQNSFPSDELLLAPGAANAVFVGIKHIDILRIKGLEFYHWFIILLLKNPADLGPGLKERATQFYTSESRELPEDAVEYFSSPKWRSTTLWETTVSASSECAYNTKNKKLGNLIKVPNFDRESQHATGKRVLVKRIASNNLAIVRRILEFEQKYDNSAKYVLLPEVRQKGYNSNSFFRSALEYAGLLAKLEVPNCFKSPGLSRTLAVTEF